MYPDRNNSRGYGGGGGGYQQRRPQQYDRNRPAFNRPAPLPEGFALYYIAVHCPDEINSQVNLFKDYMQEKYGCRAAKKSDAHLTIIPPFKAEENSQATLSDFIAAYNMGVVPFELELNDFGHFGNRVIYVDITPNERLNTLEKEANEQFIQTFPGNTFRTQPEFNPHVTIATRDIPEHKFDEAWSYFEQQQFHAAYTCEGLHLYKLTDHKWNVVN